MQEMADLADVSVGTISNWMDRHDIDTRSRTEAMADGDTEPLENPEWLREQYCTEGKSVDKIAEELGLSRSPVRRAMDTHGIDRRSVAEANSIAAIGPDSKLRDENWLRRQYHEQDKSTVDIASELDTTAATVGRWMREHGIDRRSQVEATAIAKVDGDIDRLRDPDWLREQYWDLGRTTYDIAEELGVGEIAVRNWMERHGIDRRSNSAAMTEGNTEPLQNSEWLREQYCQRKRTIYDIADEVGVAGATVNSWLHRHDIEIRSGFQYPDHLDHPVRSEWELEVAEILVDLEIEYEYECLDIEYGDGQTYTPDFVADSYVIEVKGQLYDDGNEVEKARAALETLSDYDYVVIGTELPADVHIRWQNRYELSDLFS